MIWHVPNDVSTANLDREATLKYFTRKNALYEFNASLREFYTNQFLVQRNLTSIEIEGKYLIFAFFSERHANFGDNQDQPPIYGNNCLCW